MTTAKTQFLNDNIEMTSALLIASDGSSIDIRYQIVDLSIHESIFTSCITGTISVLDGLGLVDKLPIVGEEFFSIRYRTPGEFGGKDSKFVNKVFAVYSITNRKKQDDKMELYNLNMISLEGMIDTLTTVNTNYVGLTYHEIAEKVFNNFISESGLKGGVGNGRYIEIAKKRKSINVEKSSGLQSLTTTGDSPFEIINKCANLAQSDDYPDADFVFYEDRDKFNFVTLSSLLEAEPNKLFEYAMGDQGIDERRVGKFRYNLIRELDFNKSPDALKSSHTGMYGNKIHAFDPILKKRSTINNNYLNIQREKKIPSFTTLDSHNVVSETSIYKNDSGSSHSQYYINNIFEKNYEEIEYMKDRITQKKDRYLFHQDNSFRSKGRSTMKFSLLNNYTFIIAVGGNSNLRVGEVLNIDLPLASDIEEDKKRGLHSHLFGNGKTNKFLVTGLTHNFIGTAGRYFTYITVAKDSYFSNITTSISTFGY